MTWVKGSLPTEPSRFCSALHLNARRSEWSPELFSYPLGNRPEIRRFSCVKQNSREVAEMLHFRDVMQTWDGVWEQTSGATYTRKNVDTKFPV